MMRIRKFFAMLVDLYTKFFDQFWRAKCKYITYYESLPIQENVILLESEHGKKVNGNIFYVLKYLAQDPKYNNYKLYLSSMGRHKQTFRKFLHAHGIRNVTIVMLASDEYMRLLASAKYLINDTTFGYYFIKKEGQIYINTWHGTPLKAMGKQDQSGYADIGNVQKNLAISDFLLFPSEFMKHRMLTDYMIKNISNAICVMSGYPRNEIFFDIDHQTALRDKENLAEKRIYAYLPTYRAGNKVESQKNAAYLLYYLCELDRQLTDGEILYVNLHPLDNKAIDFKAFNHIKQFPVKYETYEFLSIVDVLITDYSSVFFDFACTQRKIVLFTYDKESYLKDRGLYLSFDEFPFPQAETVGVLLDEIRTEKLYDDRNFLQTFCRYEGLNATQRLCDYTILGKSEDIIAERVPNNGKKNVLIYAGNLAANGITTSLRSLLNNVDLEERNYCISFISANVQKNKENILSFPDGVSYYATNGDLNLTIWGRIVRKLFKKKCLSASIYVKLMRNRIKQDYLRNYGNLNFDTAIQFNGYEQEVILRFSTFEGRKIIFVHSDMLQEIKTRKTQRKDVLKYAYQTYDAVAIVTQGLFDSTVAISGREDNICLVKNCIDYKKVLQMSSCDIKLDPYTKAYESIDQFYRTINSTSIKFISIGRFSPEKGHIRLVHAFQRFYHKNPDSVLIIMGGNSLGNCYGELKEEIKKLGLAQSVILLYRVSNPYPILKACDCFILSSFYEGFGLVIAEADILGKPVISTDIAGPRAFMQQHGGTLVENSEEGIYQGLKLLYSKKVSPMAVDYEAYNQEVYREFLAAMEGIEKEEGCR